MQHIVEQFDQIRPGQNVLLRMVDKLSLIKYEHSDMETEMHNVHRINRHNSVVTSNLLFARTDEERQRIIEKQSREWKRHKFNIFGTHRLDFILDEEFGFYMPSSSNRDLFLTLATETRWGDVTPSEDTVEVIVDDEQVAQWLKCFTRQKYFESVVIPFLEGMSTKFCIPTRCERYFPGVGRVDMLRRFTREVQGLDLGAFLYVGCKEEVYLLGVALDDDGSPYMQGTYVTSTKPLLYFSNNYLEFISKYDAEKPKFRGGGMCNVAVYRTYDVPGFDGRPFVFPQMGRCQNCKNTIFTGYPDVITGDLDQALAHFATTDFAEYADVVVQYAERIGEVHPSSEEPNGRFYY